MTDRRSVLAAGAALPFLAGAAELIDVRRFGARGDGRALDHDAINRAIAAAARRGGTVVVPAGDYLCFSIRLQSRMTLVLGAGATIIAADPAVHRGSYDPPEPTAHDVYQDFGHSHFRNSLIWGDGVEDVAILGPGKIHGLGLTRDGPGARWTKAGARPLTMGGVTKAELADLEPARAAMTGRGNKAVALKNARRVRLDGFTILKGGHFAIIATGCDDVSIADLTIDTDRDGIDIDACRRVTVHRCRVNSPNDDAIVLKASLALGFARACEDVEVRDCSVSGHDLGTMLDGTRGRTQQLSPDRDRVTGRIKLGTESNGGFRRITIRDCRFERSRGLALETVDGGVLENVTVQGIVMQEVTTAPLFLRLGDRRRGPPGTGVGRLRGVTIRDVTATGIDPRYPATIAGLPDARVTDVVMEDVSLSYAGGPVARAATDVPEQRDAYPEPSMFGILPAHGLYVRHAERVSGRGLVLATDRLDARPPILVEDAHGVTLRDVRMAGDPVVRLSRNVVVRRA